MQPLDSNSDQSPHPDLPGLTPSHQGGDVISPTNGEGVNNDIAGSPAPVPKEPAPNPVMTSPFPSSEGPAALSLTIERRKKRPADRQHLGSWAEN
jgi:hypothetical protein